MSQIAALTVENAIAQLTLPLVQASVLSPKKGQTQSSANLSTHVIDTVSISARALALNAQKK